MNKRELVAAIAAQTETDTKTVAKVLDGFVDVTEATLGKGCLLYTSPSPRD